MAEHFASMGIHVKASTTSASRLAELSALSIEPFIVDRGLLFSKPQIFLQANILVITVPSKNVDAYIGLLKEIENSDIEKVIFVSSTSVYENKNKTISESDGEESPSHPLVVIENLFRNSDEIRTTVVRFGGLIGYSRDPGRFLSKGKPANNPEANVNLIHRDDCIGIIGQIVEQEVWGEVFNCCADTHPTKMEFYTQAAKAAGVAAPEFIDSGTTSFKIINNQKVKRVLNYEFIYADLMKAVMGE